MILDVYPEFGVELALAVPYAYWLHKNNKLDGVITSKGMTPFYYFCNNVTEKYANRSLDNRDALKGVPNNWTHHNALAITGKDYSELSSAEQEEVNGVLDYREWICPPYKQYYNNKELNFGDKVVFITNKYNVEHGKKPRGYFNIECLYKMFDFFRDKNYKVIYKRATNREKEFTIDANEQQSLNEGYHDIKADVEGVGIITDFQLTKYFENVILMDDIVKNSSRGYNETQLRTMANCDKFISVCGGNSILSSMFGGTLISYVHAGKELRPNYFGPNSYFRKLADTDVIPVYDRSVMKTEIHDYSELFNSLEKCF